MDSKQGGKGLRYRLKAMESAANDKIRVKLKGASPMHPHLRFGGRSALKRRIALALAIVAFLIIPLALGIWSGWRSDGRRSMVRHIAGAFCKIVASPDLIFAGRDRVNILLIGRDYDRDRHRRILPTHGRADTIILVSVCRSERKVYILSIPRDTAVLISGHGLHKINAAHSLGGPELLIEVLRDQLCINIDYYARTSFEGFKKIVDAIGGVWLYVEKDMNYDDNWGNLHIHLKKGWQWLDGEKAHQYVRFRHDAEGDIGRTKRQRKFLEALAARITSPAILPRLLRIVRTAYKHVETNMTMRELMSLAAFASEIDASQIETETLPGKPVGHYWLPDREKAAQVLESMLGETFGKYMWELKISAIESGIGIRYAGNRRVKSVARRRERQRGSVEEVHELPTIPEESLPIISKPTSLEVVQPSDESIKASPEQSTQPMPLKPVLPQPGGEEEKDVEQQAGT